MKVSAESLLTEARTINSSLERSRSSLSATVNQTETVAQVLQSDGVLLKGALQNHKVELKATLQSTRRRLDRIKSVEKWERIMTRLSIGLFTTVVIFILLSRFGIFVLVQHFFFGCHKLSNEVEDAHVEL
jgi:hypothetical protein